MNKIVVPGEFLSTEEEFSKGFHTFIANGDIKSTLAGKAVFDTTKRIVSVNKENAKDLAIKGDLILGKIELVKENFVVVEVFHAFHNSKVKVFPTSKARIFISDVSNSFIKDLKQCFRIGDIVKARIKEATPFLLLLETNDFSLGVIKAYCTNCRHPLQLFEKKLKCLNCASIEERKISADYGKISEVF